MPRQCVWKIERIAMLLRHSYSRIQDYIMCPKFYKYKHIDKLMAFVDEPDYLTIGKLVHDVIKEYTLLCYKNRKRNLFEEWEKIFDEVSKKHLAPLEVTEDARAIFKSFVECTEIELEGLYGVENKISVDRCMKECGWEHETVFFRCIVDKLYLVGDTCKIVDYKTGNSFHSDKTQLETYGWLISSIHPEVKTFEFEIDHIRFNHKETWVMSSDDVIKASLKIKKIIATIEADKDFSPNPCSMCSQCPYSLDCPAIKKSVNATPSPIIRNRASATKALADIIALESRVDVLKASLRDYVEENSKVTTGDMSASMKMYELAKWDIPALVSWSVGSGVNIVDALSIDKTKLKKTLSAENLDRAMLHCVVKPSLRFIIAKDKPEEEEEEIGGHKKK